MMRKMCDPCFILLALSNFLVSSDLTAIGCRLVHHFNDATIRQINSDADLLLITCCGSYLNIIFGRATLKDAALPAMLDHLKQKAARLNHIGG